MFLAALLPDVPWYVLALVPFVIVAAYTVFGATGFGSSIIAVPVIAHWLPLTFAVPLLTALDFVSVLNASFRQWRQADRAEVLRLLPPMLIGIAAGATLLVNLPRGAALFALGLFVAAYGTYLLVGQRKWRAMRPAWAWPLGLVGGVFSVLFGSGGPIYVIYLSSRIHDKTALRATASAIVTISVTLRVGVFGIAGLLLNAPLLAAAALLLPAMFLGYYLGNRLHFALSRSGVMKLIAVLLTANGAWLVIQAQALLRAG